MEFDEDDLPGWGMGSATLEGLTGRRVLKGFSNSKFGYGFQIVDPTEAAYARRDYQKFYEKTSKGKAASRRKSLRYSRTEKGRARARAWRESEKGKETIKATRARWSETEKGKAYLKRQQERARTRYAADPAYAEKIRQKNLARYRERMKDPVYAEQVRTKARARAKASRDRASSAAQPESPRPLASPEATKLPSVG